MLVAIIDKLIKIATKREIFAKEDDKLAEDFSKGDDDLSLFGCTFRSERLSLVRVEVKLGVSRVDDASAPDSSRLFMLVSSSKLFKALTGKKKRSHGKKAEKQQQIRGVYTN